MADDPFILPVPEGATEINLRPILEPIVRRIMRETKPEDRFSTEVVDDYVREMIEESALCRLIERIKWEWIRDYLLDEGWRRSNVSPTAQYYPPDTESKKWKPSGICLVMREKHIHGDHNYTHQAYEAVRKIARWEFNQHGAIPLNMLAKQAQKILDHRSAVDRLAGVVPPAGEVSADL